MKRVLFLLVVFVSIFSNAQSGTCEDDVLAIWARNDTAFAGINDSLFRTFDGGDSWEYMQLPDNDGSPSPREIEGHGSTVIVATNSGKNRVFKRNRKTYSG